METYYCIKLSYATINIIVKNNIIIGASNYGKWMIKKPFVFICEWVAKKRGTVILVKTEKVHKQTEEERKYKSIKQ